MKTRVRVGTQVDEFLATLAPQPRRILRQALKKLADDEGDTRQLEGKLAGMHRLRVGRMRIVYEIRAVKGERLINCFYANYRSVIYSLLEQLLASGMLEDIKN
jgi:mRNA-degrading endonuclease RelE of RelBE toxin-antitoxin system